MTYICSTTSYVRKQDIIVYFPNLIFTQSSVPTDKISDKGVTVQKSRNNRKIDLYSQY